ncbi:MAG: hypothetical protein A2X88_00915 [Deltaproteobacteria bacterium GWC2_65_14]|nr:MAG: hypothetical protein A2X88_00915 [Deltaproteobacteria bacterium GWC2_65_14]
MEASAFLPIASASRESTRASGSPFPTLTHSVTYTSVTVPPNSDSTRASYFGERDPTTSIPR